MKTRGYRILPILLALGACQPAPPAATPAAAIAGPASTPARPDGVIDNSELLRLAAQAMQAHRLYAPTGDNAVEFYLAARARRPDDAAIQAALTELQPYLLIATEQALERRDAGEAARLFELLRRLDPRAPALPRLQAGLAGLPVAPASVREPETGGASASAPEPNTSGNVSAAPSTASMPAPRPVLADVATPASPPPSPKQPRIEDAVPAPASTATASPPPVSPPRPTVATTAPRLLQDAQPRYPLPALRNRVEGDVDLAFVIRPDGSVGDVRLTSAQPQGVFDAAALAVAARWRFEATGRARPWQRTVRFRLPPQ